MANGLALGKALLRSCHVRVNTVGRFEAVVNRKVNRILIVSSQATISFWCMRQGPWVRLYVICRCKEQTNAKILFSSILQKIIPRKLPPIYSIFVRSLSDVLHFVWYLHISIPKAQLAYNSVSSRVYLMCLCPLSFFVMILYGRRLVATTVAMLVLLGLYECNMNVLPIECVHCWITTVKMVCNSR